MGRSIVYSDHAKEQMKIRAITEGEVNLVLNNPDRTGAGRDGADNAWKYVNGRTLRVTSTVATTGTGKKKETIVTIITAAIAAEEAKSK